MASKACPSCKSTNLTEDDHGGETHHVCKDCGEVITSITSFEQDTNYWDNVTFCNAGGSVQGTDFGKCRNSAKREPNGAPRMLIPWLKYVREVCCVMNLTSEMQKGVTELFTQAFNHPNFRYKQQVKKRGLCGAIILIVCRQHDWPVILPDISNAVQCSKKDVFTMKQMLNREFNINTVPQSNQEDIVRSVLKRYRLMEDPFIREKTIKLVSLAKDAWLTCGRSYDAIILGAAYLVWKSAQGKGKGILHASQSDFHRQFKIGKAPVQTTRRVREIRQVLNTLYLKLPWVGSSSKQRADVAIWHLDDILKHKRFLISRVEAPAEDEDTQVETGDSQNEQTNPCEDTTENISNPPSSSGILPPSCNVKRKAKTCDTGMEPACKVPALGAWNPAEGALGKELTEKDIPESDMHLYLRTPDEVAQLEAFRNDELGIE